MPPRDWRLRVEDILESIERILRYTAGMDFDAFRANEMAVDAVIRNFAVIGEAARQVPEEIQRKHSVIPWGDMRDMRNVVIHQYFGADPKTIWETIRNDLSPLVPALRRILSETD